MARSPLCFVRAEGEVLVGGRVSETPVLCLGSGVDLFVSVIRDALEAGPGGGLSVISVVELNCSRVLIESSLLGMRAITRPSLSLPSFPLSHLVPSSVGRGNDEGPKKHLCPSARRNSREGTKAFNTFPSTLTLFVHSQSPPGLISSRAVAPRGGRSRRRNKSYSR
jgi:hypothetical protein